MLLINNSIIQSKKEDNFVISLDLSKPYNLFYIFILCTKISLGLINDEEYKYIL